MLDGRPAAAFNNKVNETGFEEFLVATSNKNFVVITIIQWHKNWRNNHRRNPKHRVNCSFVKQTVINVWPKINLQKSE